MITKPTYPSRSSQSAVNGDKDEDKDKAAPAKAKSEDKNEQAKQEAADKKAEVIEKGHKAVAEAKARKEEADKAAAALAEDQRKKAADELAKDEADKVRSQADQRGVGISIPDPDPTVPLTREEQLDIKNARDAVNRVSNPNTPPLTEEALKRQEEDDKLPKPVVQPASKLASATNVALALNDTDVERTPPYGVGSEPRLQG